MSHDGRLGRVFFTSIPKCGKNLLYSFVDRLGLSRQAALETDRRLAVQQTYMRHFHGADPRRTFPYPAGGSAELTAHGMRRFLTRVPNMPDGTVLGDHFSFDTELHSALHAARIPIAFLYRDPRDCLLSMANYVLHRGLPADLVPKMKHLDMDQALALLLTGDDDLVPFASYFDSFRGWLEADGVLALRFEDIVGPRGGGEGERQIAHLTALAEHIGWRGPAVHLTSAISGSFNPLASTFYKGQVGQWKAAFSETVRGLFQARAGFLVRHWGYDQ